MFAGKLIGYETEIHAGEEYLIGEFDMIAILKGERRARLKALMPKADTLDMTAEYLVYTAKNKARDKEGKRLGYLLFNPLRIVALSEKGENKEIKTLSAYIKKKFFRRIKKPIPENMLNCHCGI